MSPLDILRAHFGAQRRRQFDIPAAGGAPALVLYFDPVTLLELAELEPHRKKGVAELYVQAIVLKALNEFGEKAFTVEDLYHLRRQVPAPLLLALGEAILDTGPSAAAVGEPSGGRNAQPSAPPSTSPQSPDAVPLSPSPTPPPYGPDGLPLVL